MSRSLEVLKALIRLLHASPGCAKLLVLILAMGHSLGVW